MNLLKIAIFFFVTGSLLFLIEADFSLSGGAWDTAYFIWAKGKDVLFFLAILTLLGKKDRWIIKPLIFYSIINLAWELIQPMTNLAVNHPLMGTILFTILILGVITYLIKDLISLNKKEL